MPEPWFRRGCQAAQADIDLAYRTVLRQVENIVLVACPLRARLRWGSCWRTGKKCTDTDTLAEQRIGMTIADYFRTSGEEAFRARGAERRWRRCPP